MVALALRRVDDIVEEMRRKKGRVKETTEPSLPTFIKPDPLRVDRWAARGVLPPPLVTLLSQIGEEARRRERFRTAQRSVEL